MTCNFCNGTGKASAVITHSFTKKKKIISVPCICYTSTVVSAEHKLLKHLGDQYMPPDKLDPRLAVDFNDLSLNNNFLLTGSYDALLMIAKALLIEHRFDSENHHILFSRSIDIVHDFHVPQEDGSALHLSSLASYDLIIIVFGIVEKNQALAPCMAQLVQNRIDEKKPIWIYFPETLPALTPSNQEYSPELSVLLEKNFLRLLISSDVKIKQDQSESKQSVKRF
jgi:hypothetical protein